MATTNVLLETLYKNPHFENMTLKRVNAICKQHGKYDTFSRTNPDGTEYVGRCPECQRIEIIEQHFRDKPEVSGPARRMANTLDLDEARTTSLRLGGIVGHHEVVFGFPHQTVRLTHDSIRREAFGTGAAFALRELREREPGFYTMEDLTAGVMRGQLLAA